MNISLRSEHLKAAGIDQASLPTALEKLFSDLQLLDNQVLGFLKKFEIQNFNLGDDIYQFCASLESSASSSPIDSVQDGQPDANFYVVCQGSIRLLGQSSHQPQEKSILRLKAGETFGADTHFLSHPLAYRAIAASPETQVARLSQTDLLALCQTLPQLEAQLLSQAQLLERLIFFKTMTELRSQPSHSLRKWVSLLIEQPIASRTRLAEVAAAQIGHFWLREGAISTHADQSQVLSAGTSWGYPEATPPSWLAQTDLIVYCLPVEHWKIAADLIPTSGESSVPEPNSAAVQAIAPPSRVTPPSHPTDRPLTSVIPADPPQPQSETPLLFPKPINRRLLDVLQRYPWVEQQSSSDCGAACLSMIARYWGKQFPLHVLRERSQAGRSGASLKGLAKAAEDLGFQARPVRASFGRLADQTNPWIAHWDGIHYIVVYRVNRNQVIIADPALGRRTLSKQDFCAHWTGYALLLDPTQRLQETEIKQASLTRYAQALLPYRSLIIQVILVSILIQIFGLISPLFTQIILDKIVVQKSLTTLNAFAVGLLIVGIWSIGMSAVRQYLLSYFANRLDLTLIGGFINHALSLPLRFFESRRVGDIITRVQENQKIQRFLIGQVVLAWLNFVTGFVYLGLMLYYNWSLTLLVLGLIPPIVLLTLGSTPFLRRLSRRLFKETADQNSVLVEMITGIATVKSSASEREFRWGWEDQLTRQMNARFQGQKLGIGLQATSSLINSIGSTALLWYGATLVIQDQLTIGQLVAFNMMIGRVIGPVIALANLWDELQEVLISVERLNDVFETSPEERGQASRLVLPTLQGEVTFENVSFRYNEDDERNILQNISYQAIAGQTIAIVGRSGSGKSTLVKLLEGLYHPDQGRVTVDGHDIRHVSFQSLRSQLGVVPQECFLFSGTILDNITLHRPEFTMEQAIQAAKLAEAHAFVQALPLGYNTVVGERGSLLSGGQRQRIAIARALLGDPRILILDEATSSLDTESERRFQQNLAQISRDRTTFIIAHRLSTVRNADCILVLDRGILIEQGNHEELMAAQGLYYSLVQQQLNL